MPVAKDIRLDADGKYVADVDGCHWRETGEFENLVIMQTACLPYEALNFNPLTGEISHVIA